MSSISRRPLPFDIREVYGEDGPMPEIRLLDNELHGSIGGSEGAVPLYFGTDETEIDFLLSARVRLLTDFIFVKNGEVVYPLYDKCTSDFWDGLEVWGFTMSPTSRNRWLAWSLLWWIDWADKHLALVRIDRISGISKERSEHFRNGNETALWLNSQQGFSYALMEPEDLMAPGWIPVLRSWEDIGPLDLKLCRPVDAPAGVIPEWWHDKTKVAGKSAWQAIQKAYTKHLTKGREGRSDEEDEDEDDEDEHVAAPKRRKARSKERAAAAAKPRTRSRKGSGKQRVSMSQVAVPREGTSHVIARPADPSRKRKIDHVEIDLSDEAGPSGGQDEVRAQGPEGERSSQRAPFKRTRMLTIAQLAGSTAPLTPELVGSPERQTAKERLQRESQPRYSPGLATQQANALPPLQTSVGTPSGVPVPESSSLVAQAPSSQDPAPGDGSQLVGVVQAMAIEETPDTKQATRQEAASKGPSGAAPTDPQSATALVHGSEPLASSATLVPVSKSPHGSPPPGPPPPCPPPPTTPAAPGPAPPTARPPPPPADNGQSPATSATQPKAGHAVIPVPRLARRAHMSLDDRSSRRRGKVGGA
ncbi:hypothetical protein FRC06_005157 [Ceratobasidium sp. 370]|nr:hypothetical protein FRC06_005157 [Ceratobasidium sp. 370]